MRTGGRTESKYGLLLVICGCDFIGPAGWWSPRKLGLHKKKEKHTVVGKQNVSLCVRNELSFRTFGSGFNWFPSTFKMIFSEPGN